MNKLDKIKEITTKYFHKKIFKNNFNIIIKVKHIY